MREIAQRRLIVILLLPFVIFAGACSSKSKKKGPGPGDKVYPVAAMKVLKEEVPDIVEIKGNFVPSDKLEVKAETEGKVVSIPVSEGQMVNAGDPLATLNPEALNLQLEKERLELKEQEAKIEAGLSTKAAAPRSPFMRGMGARPNADANTPPNPDQNPEANPENPNPDQVGDEPPTANNPDTNPAPADAKPDNADAIARANEVTLDRIKAEIALTEKKIESATVLAGISGMISKKNIADGSAVTLGEAIFQIVRIDPILLSIFVSKKEVGNIQRGEKIDVKVEEMPDASFGGEVAYVAPEADPQNKNYEVRISVPNTQLKIKAGMPGLAIMPQTGTRKTVLVPEDAVLQLNGKSYVYIVDGAVAERKEVDLGAKSGAKIEVKEGLKEGEMAVIKGHATFKDEQEYIRVE